MWQIKFCTFFEIVNMSSCRWLFVYKKCNPASLFSFAPPSLIEGGIFWLGFKLLQWMVTLFVWSSFLFYRCTQTIPILYEWLSNCKISLQHFDILVYTSAKCGNLIGWDTCILSLITRSFTVIHFKSCAIFVSLLIPKLIDVNYLHKQMKHISRKTGDEN